VIFDSELRLLQGHGFAAVSKCAAGNACNDVSAHDGRSVRPANTARFCAFRAISL
jgi:hypothetical protein